MPGGGLSFTLESSALKRLLLEGDQTLARELLKNVLNSSPRIFKNRTVRIYESNPSNRRLGFLLTVKLKDCICLHCLFQLPCTSLDQGFRLSLLALLALRK